MKWRSIHEEKPEDGQECLFEYKHGYISGCYDKANDSGNSYVWSDVEYFVYKWIPIEEFERAFT